MPDDSDKLNNKFLEKLRKIEEMAKEAKRTNKEFPASVVDELCHGSISAIKANKEFFRGHEKKATENMGAASSHINRVFSEVSSIVNPEQDLVEFEKDIRNGKGPMGPGPVTNYNWAINISTTTTNTSNTYTNTSMVVINKKDGIRANIERAIIAAIATLVINEIFEFFRSLLLG